MHNGTDSHTGFDSRRCDSCEVVAIAPDDVEQTPRGESF